MKKIKLRNQMAQQFFPHAEILGNTRYPIYNHLWTNNVLGAVCRRILQLCFMWGG